MTVDKIDEGVTLLLDALSVGAMLNPELSAAAPFISMLVKFEAHKLKVGLADGSIISDNQGGFVSKEWAADPRHQLDEHGNFKF